MAAFGRALLPYASDRVARQWTDHFSVDRLPAASITPRTRREPPAALAFEPTLASAEKEEVGVPAVAPTVTISKAAAAIAPEPPVSDPMADTKPEPGRED